MLSIWELYNASEQLPSWQKKLSVNAVCSVLVRCHFCPHCSIKAYSSCALVSSGLQRLCSRSAGSLLKCVSRARAPSPGYVPPAAGIRQLETGQKCSLQLFLRWATTGRKKLQSWLSLAMYPLAFLCLIYVPAHIIHWYMGLMLIGQYIQCWFLCYMLSICKHMMNCF